MDDVDVRAVNRLAEAHAPVAEERSNLPRERHRRIESLSFEQRRSQRVLRRDCERQLPPGVHAIERAHDVAFLLMDVRGEVAVGLCVDFGGVPFANFAEQQALAFA